MYACVIIFVIKPFSYSSTNEIKMYRHGKIVAGLCHKSIMDFTIQFFCHFLAADTDMEFEIIDNLSQLMRLWYLSHRRPAKAQASLARAVAVRTHEFWKETKGPTKHQTSSPTGRLRMRIWRMNLRKTESTIISWYGSFIFLCLQFREKVPLAIFAGMMAENDHKEIVTGEGKSSHSYETDQCEMGRDMTKPTKWVCAQRRLRSAWASVWIMLVSLAIH